MRRVTVYASSSNALADSYFDAASRLGSILGHAGFDIVYGGGGVGLMCAMADNAMAAGAHVHGVMPGFMKIGKMILRCPTTCPRWSMRWSGIFPIFLGPRISSHIIMWNPFTCFPNLSPAISHLSNKIL